MIVLRTPKGWTGPKAVDREPIEGTFRAHQVPITDFDAHPAHLQILEQWLRAYQPERLFDASGRTGALTSINVAGVAAREDANDAVAGTSARIEGRAMEAVRTILDEHRSIAAVLHGMLYLVREVRLRGATSNFKAFHAMVYYIDAFVERFHHPKEDAYLFRLLRLRYPDSVRLIQRLEQEHRAGAEKIRVLEQTLTRYEEGGPSEFAAFAEAVQSYAAFHWNHMRLEEDELIPLARTHLTTDDWKETDEAFAGHSDPLFGHASSEHYDDLFRRVVNIVPAPIGLGPSQ